VVQLSHKSRPSPRRIQKTTRTRRPVSFRIAVSPQAPLGIYGIRVATTSGVSPLRLILLDDLPTVRAAATNLSRDAAQALSLPTAVEGTLSPQQTALLQISRRKPDNAPRLKSMRGRIGSLLDPTLRLFDAGGPRGYLTATTSPASAKTLRFCARFGKAGDYVLELGTIFIKVGAIISIACGSAISPRPPSPIRWPRRAAASSPANSPTVREAPSSLLEGKRPPTRRRRRCSFPPDAATATLRACRNPALRSQAGDRIRTQQRPQDGQPREPGRGSQRATRRSGRRGRFCVSRFGERIRSLYFRFRDGSARPPIWRCGCSRRTETLWLLPRVRPDRKPRSGRLFPPPATTCSRSAI